MSDYKVGIELLLASNGEAVLGVLGREILGVHGKVEALKGGLQTLKTAIIGAFAIGGAVALVGVMDKLIKKGAELEQTMYRLQTAGFSPDEMKAVRSNAGRVAAQYKNLTEGELVKLTAETSMVYGDPKVAMKNLGTAAAYLSAVKYRHPEDPEGAATTAEDQIFKILRSTEMRGLAQDPKEVSRALTAVLRGQEAFGDENFDPNVAFQTVKYGRLASRYLSDRFLYGPGMVAAQELGGSNYGSSLNQVMNALIGGHISKTALAEGEAIGLIDRRKVKLGPHGSFNLGNALPGRDLLQSDPDLWFQRYFAPKVDAAAHGNPSARDQIIRQMFYRTTGQQVAEILGWQTGPGGRFAKDIDRLNKAMSPEQAVAAAMGNLATSTQALQTQFDRLKTNLGDPAAKTAGKAASWAAGPMEALANFFGGHPRASGAVDAGLGIGAGVLGVIGVRSMLSIAKGVLGRLGLGGAESAAVKVAPEVAKGLGDIFGLFRPGMPGLFANVGKGIAGIFGTLEGVEAGGILALSTAVGALFVALAAAVVGLPPLLKAAADALNGLLGVTPTTPWSQGHGGRGNFPSGPYTLSPSGPPPGTRTGRGVVGNVYIDGRAAGKVVAHHMASGANGPDHSSAMFDDRAGYSPISLNISSM
jgi:hypothetical protein